MPDQEQEEVAQNKDMGVEKLLENIRDIEKNVQTVEVTANSVLASMKTMEKDAQTDRDSITSTLGKAKADSDGVSSILGEVKEWQTALNKLYKDLNDPDTGLQATLSKLASSRTETEQHASGAKAALETCKTDVQLATESVNQITTWKERFDGLKAQLDDPTQGMGAVLERLKAAQLEADKNKNGTTDSLKEAQEKLAHLEGVIQTIDEQKKKFDELRLRTEDEDTGLKATLERAKTQRDTILKVATEVSRLKDDTTVNATDVGRLKQEAEAKVQDLETFRQQSSDIKGKIAEMYSIATSATLANSFDERKKELTKGVLIWYVTMIGSLLLLSGLVVLIYLSTEKVSNLFWIRITMTSPLVLFSLFASKQYSNERASLEKYAFKSAISTALEGHVTLLSQNFPAPEYKRDILDFALTSIAAIFREPYEIDNGGSREEGLEAGNSYLGRFSWLRKRHEPRHQTTEAIKSVTDTKIVSKKSTVQEKESPIEK